MTHSLDAIAEVAPATFESARTTRYRSEEQAIPLADFGAEQGDVIVLLYEFLRELAAIVGDERSSNDPAALTSFLAQRDVNGLLERLRRLRADGRDGRVVDALHDIRGGATTALFATLWKLGRGAYRPEMSRALSIYARDHMKMMRNVVLGLDPAARERDLSAVPHSLDDLTRALRDFTARSGERELLVDVTVVGEAVIADSCVECAAIDRAAYNLLNNAVRYTDDVTVSSSLVVLENDLRVAVANSISASQRTVLSELLAREPTALFGSFTTSGSGRGLRIVSELVGRAYGITSTETLMSGGYLGAKVIDDGFVGWFHWPLAGA